MGASDHIRTRYGTQKDLSLKDSEPAERSSSARLWRRGETQNLITSYRAIMPAKTMKSYKPMNIKDIKVGETYNVRVKVNRLDKVGNVGIVWDSCGRTCYFLLDDFTPLSPEKGTKNTEPAPKYDPNRLFRKGDIVEPRKGREVYACEWEDCCFHKMDGKYEVQGDEKEGHVSVIDKETGIDCYVSAFSLELVTPVEELGPYEVEGDDDEKEYSVTNRDKFVCTYPYDSDSFYTKEQAKAAAEAERDRLNAEWRKEMEE
jgi:hypothetical protein